MRHKLNMAHKSGNVFLLFGKNALSILSFPFWCAKLCVAASGVMRFSVRSFGCALFYFTTIIFERLGYLMNRSNTTKEISQNGNSTFLNLLYSISSVLLVIIATIVMASILGNIARLYNDYAILAYNEATRAFFIHGTAISIFCGGITFSYIQFQQKFTQVLKSNTVAILAIVLSLITGAIYSIIGHTLLSMNIAPNNITYIRFIPAYYGFALPLLTSSLRLVCWSKKIYINIIFQIIATLIYVVLSWVISTVIYSLYVSPDYLAYSGIIGSIFILLMSSYVTRYLSKHLNTRSNSSSINL